MKKLIADHLRFLKEVAPTLASDQVFYEDKTEKESLKQVNRLNCNNYKETPRKRRREKDAEKKTPRKRRRSNNNKTQMKQLVAGAGTPHA